MNRADIIKLTEKEVYLLITTEKMTQEDFSVWMTDQRWQTHRLAARQFHSEELTLF